MGSPRILTEESLKLEPLGDMVRKLSFASSSSLLIIDEVHKKILNHAYSKSGGSILYSKSLAPGKRFSTMRSLSLM